jgi:hypothetical protein
VSEAGRSTWLVAACGHAAQADAQHEREQPADEQQGQDHGASAKGVPVIVSSTPIDEL